MTKAKGNVCKAAAAIFVALAMLLAVFAGLGVIGAYADDTAPTVIHRIGVTSQAEGKHVRFNVYPDTAYTPKAENHHGIHITGQRVTKADVAATKDDFDAYTAGKTIDPSKFFYRKFGYSGASDALDQEAYDAYDEETLGDFYKNILLNGHTVVEWWNGVDDGNGGKEYKELYMSISDSAEGYFDIQNYVTTVTEKDGAYSVGRTPTAFAEGDTVVLKKGLKLCANYADVHDKVVGNDYRYYTKDGKHVVLGRNLAYTYKDGSWTVDTETLAEDATVIAYRGFGVPHPAMFDIYFEKDKWTPKANGTAGTNSEQPLANEAIAGGQPWEKEYAAYGAYYDKIKINGKTLWELFTENGNQSRYGLHISHEQNWIDAYGGDFLRINAPMNFEDGDTIEFDRGFMLIERTGGRGSMTIDWQYYAGADGKQVKTDEKLMFVRRLGKWVKTDLDAIRGGTDANGKVTLTSDPQKMYNLAVTVGGGLFTNTVNEAGYKGTNFEENRADVKYSDFFDNLLFNGKTAATWFGEGVNFNIHVTADGLKISKKSATGANMNFETGDTVRFIGGFSLPSYDNDAWGFYTGADGKRVIMKTTVEFKLSADGIWKKSFGVFKGLEFQTLPEGEPVVAVGGTVQYAATAIKVNPNDEERAVILYESSDEDIASVSNDGTVTGKKVGYATITATIESENGITKSYDIFVYNANAKPEDGLVSGGKIYIPMGKSNGEYYITDPLDKGIKALGYKVEEAAAGTDYDYKITVNANLYTNARRPKDLLLPVYYGKGGGAKGDIMLADGAGKVANKNSGYLLAAGDVEASAKAANGTDATDIIEWKSACALALTVKKNAGEALVTFAAYLPAAPQYHGVFGEVVAKAHKLGEFKALVVLTEAEAADTSGKFLAARANEVGDCLFDYGQWNPTLNGGKGKWIVYGVKGASDHVDGSLWKGWNNFQHTTATYYNAVKEDFFDKILINGKTHKVYSAEEHVDFNIHMRSEYLQLRQYGADGQDDKGKPRQWADGTTIEFVKGFRLIEKHKDGIEGKDNGGKQIECTVCYLHEDTGKYWTLGFNQKYVYNAKDNAWYCYNDIKEVTLDKTEVTVKPGSTVQLTATAVKAVAESDMVGTTVKFDSSDETLATVDATGLVTVAEGKEGVVVITATAEDGTSATCTVTVSSSDTPNGGDGESGGKGCGCGNSIAGSSVLLGALLLLALVPMILLARKKSKKA